MPTYDYECTNGHQFEVEQRITDEPLKTCRECRAKVRRLISQTSFVLKGGGWYSDGYSSGGNGKSSSSSKDSDSKSPSSGSSSDSASSSSSKSGSSDKSSSSSKSGSSSDS
jgi:putative FmdB family regulatory protein